MTLYLVFLKRYRLYALVSEGSRILYRLAEDDRDLVLWATENGFTVRLQYGMEWTDTKREAPPL